jgi:hypothetical protein
MLRLLWAVLACMLDRARWYWSSGVPPIMESQNDREFAAVVAAIADLRKADRSTAITVTPLFQPMLDRRSLTELKNYVLFRYPRRGHSEKSDLVEIGEQQLRGFNRAFLYKDSLSITFAYSGARETVENFVAVLLNDQL